MWLLLIFILVPIIEIGLFIQVGGWIGLWPTLAIVVGMAFLGSWLLRNQGLRAIGDLQRSAQEFRDPTGPIAHGALIMFAGLLLLTPGFFTDIIGLLLLVPAVRTLAIQVLVRRMVTVNGAGFTTGPAAQARDDIVDAVYVEISPRDEIRGPSAWTRH
jgi:UPF0716 protein FxsA